MAGELERQRRDLERSNRLAAWAEMARQVAHEVKNPLTPDPALGRAPAPRLRATAAWTSTPTLRDLHARRSSSRCGRCAASSPSSRPSPARRRRSWRAQDPARAAGATSSRPYRAALPDGRHARARLPGRRALRAWPTAGCSSARSSTSSRTRCRPWVTADTIDVRLRVALPGRVEVEVADSGPGLDPEVRDRIFEPFFSTKTGGSGLGLALVKKIAEDHGGGVRPGQRAGRGHARDPVAARSTGRSRQRSPDGARRHAGRGRRARNVAPTARRRQGRSGPRGTVALDHLRDAGRVLDDPELLVRLLGAGPHDRIVERLGQLLRRPPKSRPRRRPRRSGGSPGRPRLPSFFPPTLKT